MSSRSGRRLLATAAVTTVLIGGIGAAAGAAAAQTEDSSSSISGADAGASSSDLGVLAVGSATLPIEAVVGFAYWVTTGNSWVPSPVHLEFCRLLNPNCYTVGGQG